MEASARRIEPIANLQPGGGSSAIDLPHLRRMTLGERSLEAEVLALFNRQAGMLLARMRSGPPAAVAACAHTLKGAALGVGAWCVADACRAVEASAADEIAFSVERLAVAIDEARTAIEQVLVTR
ncbi:MAG: Hpt domain-containing protein [Hyphomicrobiales bacterium]|nr:Hpt domain-containing protein [Hyphomicrobiales bacterium]